MVLDAGCVSNAAKSGQRSKVNGQRSNAKKEAKKAAKKAKKAKGNFECRGVI